MEPNSLIELPPSAIEAMIAHARACLPNEACGLIAGETTDRGLHFRRLYSLTNSDSSPISYTIDPTEHFRALQDAEGNGWGLIGAFHSHPQGAGFPSETDIARAAEPDWVWFVVGLHDLETPDVGGFWIKDGKASRAYPAGR